MNFPMTHRLEPATWRLVFSAMMVCAGLALSTAANAQSAAPSTPEKRIVVLDDIAYRSGPSSSWRLDLAVPEGFGSSPRPAIVIIHGGGWTAGSRRARPYRSMLVEYALKGYVTLSVGYRLHGEAPFPASVEDVDCAVRWLRAHASRYNVDPNRIGAYGHSAGAHLALMLASSPPAPAIRSDCEWNAHSSALTSVAAGAPPTILPARLGDSQRFSPATYPSAQMVPILIVAGTADPVVTIGSVDGYVEQLKAAGAPDVTYLRIEGADHGVAYEHFMERSMAAINDFFARTLRLQ
jgi:acetyl esterase/lipase